MKLKLISAVAGICVASSSVAFAADPFTTTFGPQPNDTFASHSIDNSAVESTSIQDGANTITLDLTSTPHGATAPAVGNNGAGLFYATPGHTGANLPLWTFDYAISVNNNAFSDYTFKLVYSDGTSSAFFDPTVAGVGDDSNTTIGGVTSQQNDENLGFTTGAPSGFPALSPAFDADANGLYTFQLEAFSGGVEIGSDTINVSVPDATSTMALLGACVSGVFFLSKKTRRD